MSLAIEDRHAVARLKYLRHRSMRSARWQDGEFVRKFVTPHYMHWADESPLEPFRLRVIASLDEYRKATKDGTGNATVWERVVSDVDGLIAEAERINGHRIKARS
jgi:hypothetical protein